MEDLQDLVKGLHAKPHEVTNLNIKKNIVAPVMTWSIANVLTKRKAGCQDLSELFSWQNSECKMQIDSYLNGCNEGKSSSLTVFLRVYDNIILKWPFSAYITFQISNQYRPDTRKTLKTYCEIPNSSSYSLSSAFHFDYDLLAAMGLLTNDMLTIQCFIQMEC